MKPKHLQDTVTGTVGAIGAMAGAVVGSHYLAPEHAGTGGLALCMVAGILAGWAAGYVFAVSLGLLLGWKAVGIGYLTCLLALLALLGGVAGYHVSDGEMVFALAGAAALFIPNAIILYTQRRRFYSTPSRPDENATEDDRQPHWPLWMRFISLLSSIVVIAWGGYTVVTQSMELSRGAQPGSGVEITGTTAVIIGTAIVVFGLIFLLYGILPGHSIWHRGLRRTGRSKDT